MRKFPFFLALTLAGCGGDGGSFAPAPQADQPAPQPVQHAPEIANLSLSPDTVIYMDGDGNVSVTAQFEYTDVGLDIQNLRIDISDGTSLTVEPAAPIDSASGTITEEFGLSTSEIGEFTVEIWLVDRAGASSNHLTAVMRVESPIPEITVLDPAEVQSGSRGISLTVTGTDFLPGATVTWDGADRATDYVSDTSIVSSIPAADLAAPDTVSVRVRNPAPTAGASNELSFVIAAAGGTEPSGFPILITETIDGAPPNGPGVNGGMDWDGGFVTFASRASNLVSGDTNSAYDLFVRDTCRRYMPDHNCTPSTTRAVMGLRGAEPNGDVGWTVTSPDDSLAVSFNGRFVAFVSSASNLVLGDTNGVDDVFLVDTCIETYPGAPCTPDVIRGSGSRRA